MKKYIYKICKTEEMLLAFKEQYERATSNTLSVPLEYLSSASRVVFFYIGSKTVAGFVINGNTKNLRYLSDSILSEDEKLNVLKNNDLKLSSLCEITCLHCKHKLKGIDRIAYYLILLFHLWKVMKSENKKILLGGSYVKGIRKSQKKVLNNTIWTYFTKNGKGQKVLVEIYYGIVDPLFYIKVVVILTLNIFLLSLKNLIPRRSVIKRHLIISSKMNHIS